MIEILKSIVCHFLGCRETVAEQLPLCGLEKTVCTRCGITGIRSIK